MIGDIFFAILGLTALVSIAILFSNNRSRIDWRLVATESED